MSTHVIRPDDILKRAHAVGNYYGFTPLATAAAKKKASVKLPYPEGINLDVLDQNAKDVVGFLKHVRDAGLTPSALEPLFLWHTNAAPGRQSPKHITVQFHILGVDHAIADAVLIRAVRSFMTDIGKYEPVLHLNSMGDKETPVALLANLPTSSESRARHFPRIALIAQSVTCLRRRRCWY